ncbi:hypothetical protein LIER_39975 [Lithospermum erythrorhizon]|uniref:Reverse transcriptase domain-containing protein n=1 Tax=Lithospermum erythrorhizon TaxID=34254 RepID=A0AAV3QMX4_LITER
MQELVCRYHKRVRKLRCALKIAIMKACDTVSWRFMWAAMKALKYPDRFIELVKACVSTTWLSCKEIDLTNLNFADDLFVLSAAIKKYMRLIGKVLKDYGELSRLDPNLTKSTRYFAGIDD